MIKKWIENRKMFKSGFTLIELLIVISIIAILASILLSGLSKGMGEAKLLKCKDNLRKLYQGLIVYDTEFKTYPRGDDYKGAKFWEALRNQPTPETAVLQDKNRDDLYICPIRGGVGKAGICHYRGPNYEVSDALKESDPVGADMAENHASRKSQNPISVLYWGGTIISVNYGSSEWQVADESLQE
jgi:prepilin-type N-terminal cleavage/methylation domain-containing protein